ncbi:MAG: hypothetical protein CVU91_10290 [Firmicutes bacterium HGW-Firmicutes-16]|nr:MAG: hypothetical protein CVU91_10290 [Firmicutes bacterium HGW-Firmicutes-16]
MKKLLLPILVVILILSLAACSSNKLADIYKEDEVIAKAKNVVETINTQDYDAVVAFVREDLQSQLTADSLESVWKPMLDESGVFKDYKTVVAYGQKSKSTSEEYAVCVLVCTYENATRTFTISLDKDLAVVGMYMK